MWRIDSDLEFVDLAGGRPGCGQPGRTGLGHHTELQVEIGKESPEPSSVWPDGRELRPAAIPPQIGLAVRHGLLSLLTAIVVVADDAESNCSRAGILHNLGLP